MKKHSFSKKIAGFMMALMLAFILVPTVSIKVNAEEYITIEDEEVPLNDMSENGMNFIVILAVISGVATIAATFIWLRNEKKNVVEEEE